MEVDIKIVNKKCIIGDKEYKIIYNVLEQIGDNDISVEGVDTYILFDASDNTHYKLYSGYEVMWNEEGPYNKYYQWNMEAID